MLRKANVMFNLHLTNPGYSKYLDVTDSRYNESFPFMVRYIEIPLYNQNLAYVKTINKVSILKPLLSLHHYDMKFINLLTKQIRCLLLLDRTFVDFLKERIVQNLP